MFIAERTVKASHLFRLSDCDISRVRTWNKVFPKNYTAVSYPVQPPQLSRMIQVANCDYGGTKVLNRSRQVFKLELQLVLFAEST